MEPRLEKVRGKLIIFVLILVRKKNRGPVTRNVHILFLYTGQGRFVRETKEELEDVEAVKEDEREDEREDEPEMAKTYLTENDDTENDESEGDYVLLINLVP